MVTYHIVHSYVKEILLASLYKKSEKLLENNFVYEQIIKFLLEYLLDSHDILRLEIFINVEFNKFKT